MKAVGRKSFISALAFIGGVTPITFLTSCSDVQTIQFANFESYMDSDLIKDLESKYNIQFPYYTVTENIETKFKRYYDLAVPSCYEMFTLLKKGLLSEIDWGKLDIGVSDATDAKRLFNEQIINSINDQFQEYVNKDTTFNWESVFPGKQVNVLKYGIPYFAQSFTFAYKSDQPIKFYTYKEHTETSSPKWEDIYYTVANSDYFHRDPSHSVSMLDDSKSIYDIARICETSLAGLTPTNEVPEKTSESIMIKTFDSITNTMKDKSSKYILNTDSGTIAKLFADPYGSAAAFTWSGDTIYAAKGAEEYAPSFDTFHLQSGSNASLDEVDFIVINNKNNKDEFAEKKDDIYKVIKQVCFDGLGASDIGAYDNDKQRYKYWTMQNFDSLNYTPVLNTTYNHVVDPNSAYWVNEGDPAKAVAIYIEILKQVTKSGINHLYGRTITPRQNSDIHWAWMKSKGKF